VPVELALYQPDIARNAGQMLRLCACFGIRLHVIHPAGFAMARHALRHGVLDYFEHADYIEHDDFASFERWRAALGRRLMLLTTGAADSAYGASYRPDDVLMVGRESAGVPGTVAAAADLRVRIPMRPGLRSINVALAAAMIVGEALRQTDGFVDLI
jgi:tRNA (cytidine/uridine-2'-O-)-methyltransferase